MAGTSRQRSPHSEPLLQDALPGLPEEDLESPTLIGSESYEWNVIPDLDKFLRNLYMYHKDKGLATILTGRLLNQIATLAFLLSFSAVLLLCINWHALGSECVIKGSCDIWEVAIYKRPLRDHSLPWAVFCCTFLAIFSLYLLWAVYDLLAYLPDLVDVAHFCHSKLGVSERQVQSITWPEFVFRLVELQRTTRLCIQRDLSEHDVVSRIMRRDNYLIGMLNKGVLPLHLPLFGLRQHLMLTKTLEWSLHRCVFNHMFDPATFRVRPEFVSRPELLRRRFRVEAAVMLLLSPFVLCFLLLYFFMRNAEKFYNHPASIGARRWSLLARWRMREFNELEHYIHHRLNAAHKAAERYVGQFPNPLLSHVARFVAFVTGSFVALLLFVTLVDEKLLERPLWGRHLVWWMATLGIVLAISRTFVLEPGVAFDPEMAMLEVASHTHYLPRHWRGRAHTREVQGAFEGMFQFKAALFLEEVASVLLTPFVLALSMPRSADAITGFVRDFTTHVEGVGDICSLAAFDFSRHGNTKYGSPYNCPKTLRSRQGKMEKSFMSFVATYPTWQPQAQAAQAMLASLGHHHQQQQQQEEEEYCSVPHQPRTSAAAGGGAHHYREQPHGASSMMESSAGVGDRYVQLAPAGPGLVGGGAGSKWAAALAHTLRPPVAAAAVAAAEAGGATSLFASADLGVGLGATSLADSDCEARVAVGHAALQSLYETREQGHAAQRQRFQSAVDARRAALVSRREQHQQHQEQRHEPGWAQPPAHYGGSHPSIMVGPTASLASVGGALHQSLLPGPAGRRDGRPGSARSGAELDARKGGAEAELPVWSLPKHGPQALAARPMPPLTAMSPPVVASSSHGSGAAVTVANGARQQPSPRLGSLSDMRRREAVWPAPAPPTEQAAEMSVIPAASSPPPGLDDFM